MMKILGEKTKKGTISTLRHSESFNEATPDPYSAYDPVAKVWYEAENGKELINKMIGYRNTDTGEYIKGAMEPEDFPADELFIKLQDKPGFNTKRRIGDGESDVEYTHLLIQIPEGTPVEKWPDFKKIVIETYAYPEEIYQKGKGGGRYTPTVHIGDCFIAASGIHVSQDGKSAHFHLIVGSRTLNNKNYYGIDSNNQPIILPTNPDWRSITRRSLLSSEAEFRELKRKRINSKLEELGLPQTHWLNRDEKMDENKVKAKDALQEAIQDTDGADLKSELDKLESSKKLSVKEFSEEDINDAEIHQNILNSQKLLAAISKQAEEKLAEAYREIELVNITRSSIENAVALAKTKQELASTSELLSTTQENLDTEQKSRIAFETALQSKNIELSELNDKYDTQTKAHQELIDNYEELEDRYDELDEAFKNAKAQHIVDLQEQENSYQTEISVINATHNKAVSKLKEEHQESLQAQELYYEQELSAKDDAIKDITKQFNDFKEEHDKQVKSLQADITNRDNEITKLNTENAKLTESIKTVREEKETQRIDFERIINDLKLGHDKAIGLLEESNKALTDEVAKQVKAFKMIEAQNKELKKEVEKLTKAASLKDSENKDLKTTNAQLTEENKDLNEALRVFETDNEDRLRKAKNKKPDDDSTPNTPKKK